MDMRFHVLLLLVFLNSGIALAQEPVGVSVYGVYDNPIVGVWPPDTEYSWVQQTLFSGGIHSWRLLPGSEGGVIFNKAQAQDAMIAPVLLFNVIRHIFTVNNGVTIDQNLSIDMANLRIHSDTGGMGTTTDHGSGSGYDTIVPLVSDINALAPGENGWVLLPDDSYHLIYNTIGFCATCKLKFHLYGSSFGDRDGDVTLDGVVDAGDSLLAQRYLLGEVVLSAQQKARGDIYPADGDGDLDLRDVLLLRKKLVSAP